jgi:magnesium transporter
VAVLATRNVPVAEPDDAAGELLARMGGRLFDTVAYIPVCVQEQLVGLVAIELLHAAAPGTRVDELMDPNPPTVRPGVDQEVAAWRMVQHGESALAVVDSAGRYLGVVPPTRMLAVLLGEHEEDMSRLAGVVHDTERVLSATVEPLWRRVRHRLPWLLVGLAGAMAAALIVSGYEEQISRNAFLAFFLPGVVYMADAVGTQTETVVVRGLSVGVPVGRVAVREASTGLIIGVIVAALFVPLGLLLWRDPPVLAAVGASLFLSCAVASVVAMALPYLLARVGRDPAYGSGPLSTVVQDLLTIACYCAIVGATV